jgi:predicted 3-demethylubiquinone-9 3-methyltransferase (glyoxalase superfamily)
MKQTITPFLWFDDNAEAAMEFYGSIFTDHKVINVARGGDGKAFMFEFELNGQRFMGLNGGPQFSFTEAVSFFVSVETQDEVDELWEKLSAGGEAGQCGWLKDKFGLSWQIVPTALGELMGDPDPAKAGRVREAMMKMTKIEIAQLQQAHDQA